MLYNANFHKVDSYLLAWTMHWFWVYRWTQIGLHQVNDKSRQVWSHHRRHWRSTANWGFPRSCWSRQCSHSTVWKCSQSLVSWLITRCLLMHSLTPCAKHAADYHASYSSPFAKSKIVCSPSITKNLSNEKFRGGGRQACIRHCQRLGSKYK